MRNFSLDSSHAEMIIRRELESSLLAKTLIKQDALSVSGNKFEFSITFSNNFCDFSWDKAVDHVPEFLPLMR